MGYKSRLFSKEIVVDTDKEASEIVRVADNGMNRFHGGVPRDRILYPQGQYNSMSALPDIPKSEWEDRIRDMEKEESRLSDLIRGGGAKCKDQNGLPYCWIFACVGALEAVRARDGHQFVELSAVSAGAKITGFRSRGGFGMEGIKHLKQHGVVPESLWPECKLNRQYDTPAAWKEAEKYKLTEWDDIPDYNLQAVANCLLRRIPITGGYNWWGHEVYLVDLVILSPGVFGIRFRNSWGSSYGEDGFSILKGSKMLPNDAEAPRVAVLAA